MQSSVTDYFKTKKRTVEDAATSKSKLVAVSSSFEKHSPNPLRSTSDSSAEVELNIKHEPDINNHAKLQDIKSLCRPSGRSAKRLFERAESTADGPSPKKLPAYQRFHYLIQKVPTITPPALPSIEGSSSESRSALFLPYKFKVLEELFNAVETVTSVLHNRKELITFMKVKLAVHELVRQTPLKEKHLGQILTVLPSCYSLTQEKVTSFDSTSFNYQLTITMNHPEPGGISVLTLAERRRTFHQNLISICLNYHKTFLESIDLIVPEGSAVTRWHPKFQLDEIPDIQPVDTPELPKSYKTSTGRDIMAKAQHILNNTNPRMKKALQDLLKRATKIEKDKDSLIWTSQKLDSVSANKRRVDLKGISQILVEKVRTRELQKSMDVPTCSPGESKNVMLSRLPEFVKVLRDVMATEQMSVLPICSAIGALSHSIHGDLSSGEAEELIRLMSSVLPDWLKIISLGPGEYVEMNKQININDVFEKLKQITKNI